MLPVSIWISRMTHLLFPLLFFLPAVDRLLSLLPTHHGHAKMMASTPELPALPAACPQLNTLSPCSKLGRRSDHLSRCPPQYC